MTSCASLPDMDLDALDVRLCMQMDAEGWIPLAVVANFNRVRMLTPDMMLIVEAVKDSLLVEVSAESTYLRAKDSWQKWVEPRATEGTEGTAAEGAAAVGSPAQAGAATAAPSTPAAAGAVPVAPSTPAPTTPAAPAAIPATPSLLAPPALPMPSTALGMPSTALGAAAASKHPVSRPPLSGGRANGSVHAPNGAGKADDEADEDEDEDLFEMDEDQDRGDSDHDKEKESGMTDRDIEKLILVTPSQKRGGRLDNNMAKLIDDGLAAYERELMEVRGHGFCEEGRRQRVGGNWGAIRAWMRQGGCSRV